MTPWAAGLGFLVSFTASAGTDGTLGASLMAARDWRTVPALPAGTGLIGTASPVGDEPLRGELKAAAHVYPVVQRERKSDPAVAMGASFSRRAAGLRDTSIVFAGLGGVSGVLTPGSAIWDPELEPERGFVPVPDLGVTTGGPGTVSTGPSSADITEDSAEGGREDGSTPPVPRAVALSSTTPAPADAVPVEVAAASLALPETALWPDRTEPAAPETARHRYADLINPESLDREQRCLAEAVYFEARSEPEAGQAAVAQVVLNRVKSGLYPSNVCGVVYQNRHHYMGCQFSFACEGKSLRITDSTSWQNATRIAQSVIEGRTYLSEVGASTHYHADYVRPGWSRRLRKMDVIGRHIFYTLKPGQT